MAKVFNYTIILAFTMAFLSFALADLNNGIPVTFSSSVILTIYNFVQPQNWTVSFFQNNFVLILTGLIGAAAIIVGFFGRQPTESYVLIPMVVLLAGYSADIASIVIYINSNYPDMAFIGAGVGMIMFALAAGYAIALVQWWRGNDI